MSSLAIAWCLLNKNVSTVILGASKLEQLQENLKSTEVLELLTENIQKELLLI
jgi:aryl-alcohol dehydrogenase-like predicted oxidoreductase